MIKATTWNKANDNLNRGTLSSSGSATVTQTAAGQNVHSRSGAVDIAGSEFMAHDADDNIYIMGPGLYYADYDYVLYKFNPGLSLLWTINLPDLLANPLGTQPGTKYSLYFSDMICEPDPAATARTYLVGTYYLYQGEPLTAIHYRVLLALSSSGGVVWQKSIELTDPAYYYPQRRLAIDDNGDSGYIYLTHRDEPDEPRSIVERISKSDGEMSTSTRINVQTIIDAPPGAFYLNSDFGVICDIIHSASNDMVYVLIPTDYYYADINNTGYGPNDWSLTTPAYTLYKLDEDTLSHDPTDLVSVPLFMRDDLPTEPNEYGVAVTPTQHTFMAQDDDYIYVPIPNVRSAYLPTMKCVKHNKTLTSGIQWKIDLIQEFINYPLPRLEMGVSLTHVYPAVNSSGDLYCMFTFYGRNDDGRFAYAYMITKVDSSGDIVGTYSLGMGHPIARPYCRKSSLVGGAYSQLLSRPEELHSIGLHGLVNTLPDSLEGVVV